MHFQESSNRKICILAVILGLCFATQGVLYQERLDVEDLKALFGDEECIEGSFSVSEDGDPVVTPSGTVSTVQPIISSTKTKTVNETFTDKSPMSLLYELAEFNHVKVQFTLTHEKGPSHKKQFVVSLKLGEEEFSGEGSSIKRAQHEASKLALNSTLYEHPPKKEKINVEVKTNKSPVEKLEVWARKHNDATVAYSYFEQSQISGKSIHTNYYHHGMYSRAENIYKAKVTVANQHFNGEGFSLDIAKQNAAKNALASLQITDGFCMLSDKEKNFFDKLLDFDRESESPISLVYEFGTISNMPVSFDLNSEEGPAHMKKFIFRCNVGDRFESFGEGSSKKAAKTEAAENMIQELKEQTSLNRVNCGDVKKPSKPKKKKSRNLIKSVTKSYSEEDDEEAIHSSSIPEELDPVSKLFQIQQAKHQALPIFTLLEKSNKEFSIQVVVNDLTAIGTGSNKKVAKKNAAQAMLDQMGYSTAHKKDRMYSQNKKEKFTRVRGLSKKKNIVPGIDFNSNKNQELRNLKDPTKSDPNNIIDKTNNLKKKPHHEEAKTKPQSNSKKSESSKKLKSDLQSQLQSLSQQMGFKFQFSNFPKVNNSEVVSIISLTTDPPKVCYGVGETSDLAQAQAAKSALGSLYKAQLDHIARILQDDTTSPEKPRMDFIEEDHLVRSNIASQKG